MIIKKNNYSKNEIYKIAQLSRLPLSFRNPEGISKFFAFPYHLMCEIFLFEYQFHQKLFFFFLFIILNKHFYFFSIILLWFRLLFSQHLSCDWVLLRISAYIMKLP